MKKSKSTKSGRVMADFINEFCFGAFVERMINLMGEKAAAGVLRDTSRQVMKNILAGQMNSLSKTVKRKTLAEKLKFCYTMLEEFFPFECAVKFGENKKEIILWITKCPHIEYTKKNPVACWVCAGMKLGAMEMSSIKDALRRFEVRKRLALGDDHCEIVIKK